MEDGGEVFYSVRVTLTNKQFITQNIETESVTVRLPVSGSDSATCCSSATTSATLVLPAPHHRPDQQISQIRRLRNKRQNTFADDTDEDEDQNWFSGKKSRC